MLISNSGYGRSLRRVTSVASAFVVMMGATFAHAFCLARQCDRDSQTTTCLLDAAGCSIEGVALRRLSPCISFGVASGSAQRLLGISDAEFEQLVVQAYALWSSVDCGGGMKPGFSVRSVGPVPSASSFACLAVPENNVDVWAVNNAFANPPVITSTTGVVAGRTTPTFLLPEGKVFDADVDLNELWLVLNGEDSATLRAFVRTVAAHEAGHALGLAHSQDPQALMYRSYQVTADRVPTADDIQGICALFPPHAVACGNPYLPPGALSQAECDATANKENAGGCNLAARQTESPFGSIALLAVGLTIVCLRRSKMRTAREHARLIARCPTTLQHNRHGTGFQLVV